jgi:hypothetical protein
MSNHLSVRQKLCLICLDRAVSVGSRMIKVDTPLFELIINFFMEGYSPDDVRLPRAVCNNCRQKLQKFEKKDFSCYLPEFPDFSPMAKFRIRRGCVTCSCMLCQHFAKSTQFGARNKIKKMKVSFHLCKRKKAL